MLEGAGCVIRGLAANLFFRNPDFIYVYLKMIIVLNIR